jgi:hypothetical protein
LFIDFEHNSRTPMQAASVRNAGRLGSTSDKLAADPVVMEQRSPDNPIAWICGIGGRDFPGKDDRGIAR